jgi:hypothetical protein
MNRGRNVVAGTAAVAALAATVMVWSPWSASAGGRGGYEPVLHPKDFSTRITNPYFPLPVGRKLIYRGMKDGHRQKDVVTVTRRTKLVAEGIRARVVTDVATHNGRLLEKTADWYAQDRAGNVWYVGERTAEYKPDGTVDRSGSWEAGVHDGEPGIVMKAHPHIPMAYRQEYLRGKAEDTAWVVRINGSITVPYGTFHHILVTLESARIEPGLYDKKIYARGIGIVSETALTGPRETARLVRVKG